MMEIRPQPKLIRLSAKRISVANVDAAQRAAWKSGKPLAEFLSSVITPWSIVPSYESILKEHDELLIEQIKSYGPVFVNGVGLSTSGHQADGTYHYPGSGPLMIDVIEFGGMLRIDISASAPPSETGPVAYIVGNKPTQQPQVKVSVAGRVISMMGLLRDSSDKSPEEESLHH